MLLVRVVVGKVADTKRVEGAVIQGDHEWNCLIWVRVALKQIEANGKGVGTSKLGCQTVRLEAMRLEAMGHVKEKKAQHDLDGQGSFDMKKAATFDLLEGRELIAWVLASWMG